MTKICKLKIDPKFYDLISKGIKKVEVRKTNKKYINVLDLIGYQDMNTGGLLGFARVSDVRIYPKKTIYEYQKQLLIDDETIDDLERNEKDYESK